MLNYNEYLKQAETRRKIDSYLYSQYDQKINKLDFKVPQRLFKYSKVNEYIVGDLENDRFTMCCPTLFNDFFDSAIHRNSFKSRYADELQKQELLEMYGFFEQIPIEIEKLKKDAEHEDRFLSQYMKEVFRVGCLSECNDSILMWSHYTDNNNGICIEYDLTSTQLCPFMYPVVYVPTPIDCSELCDIDIDLATLLSTIVKYNIWEYEKEWRILLYYPTAKNEKKHERIHAMIPKPKAIYLGRTFLQHWINVRQGIINEDKSLFIRLCTFIKKNNIDVYVMKNKILSYELYPERIDIESVKALNEGKLYEKYLL